MGKQTLIFDWNMTESNLNINDRIHVSKKTVCWGSIGNSVRFDVLLGTL